MKFTYSWLLEHLHTKETLADLLHHMTCLGIEVESFDDPSTRLAPFLIAEIKRIQKHPNADRLNVCDVSVSSDTPETVQVVCGAPNVYEGMKTVFAHVGTYIPGLNITLKKGNIRDVESCGMLCSAEELGLEAESTGILDLPKNAPVGRAFSGEYGHDDPVIEVGLTPNRADCFGVRGIARDLAAASLGNLKPLKITPISGKFEDDRTVVVENHTDCPVFMGRTIRNVKNCESPDWLKQRLRKVGLKSISAIVDITNYVNYDLSRPSHVFDADALQGNLVVRRAHPNEKLIALDEAEYTLTNEDIVIADDNGAQAIAGIKGGLATGTQMSSKNILIECALFDPKRIAKTGRNHSLLSDARTRFERGVDPESVRVGIEKITEMILSICGGTPGSVFTAGTVPHHTKKITLFLKKLELLSGMHFNALEVERILTGLGCTQVTITPDHKISMLTPSWRFDLHIEEDIIEEIIRLHGYNNIPTADLPVTLGKSALSFEQTIPKTIIYTLAGLGLNEQITYSFQPTEVAKLFGGGHEKLRVQNPISAQLSQMRPSLLGNLLTSIKENSNHGVKSASFFEVGSTYHYMDKHIQKLEASGVLFGQETVEDWQKKPTSYDMFSAKIIAYSTLQALGLNVDSLQIIREAPCWYHPGKSGALKLGPKNTLAYFGELHPRILKNFDIDAPVFAFEIFVQNLPLKLQKNSVLRHSIYQQVERDFAFVVDKNVEAAELIRAIEKAEKKLISSIRLFDIYEGKGVEDGKKSLAFSVTLSPTEKTLTDEEIQKTSADIIANVEKITGGVLRA